MFVYIGTCSWVCFYEQTLPHTPLGRPRPLKNLLLGDDIESLSPKPTHMSRCMYLYI